MSTGLSSPSNSEGKHIGIAVWTSDIASDRRMPVFRTSEIVKGRWELNGKKVKLHGANRHETDPMYGHHVPRERHEQDIALVDEANNAAIQPRVSFWYNTFGMKILFLSDIHGVPSTLEAAFASASTLGYDKIVLLGDLLYHGPRNGVPDLYDPVKVAEMLNLRKDKIIAVRGNCDAEVDQMMLHFPIMAEYSEILTETARFFLTHGHHWNEDCLPPLPPGAALVHGHTHLPVLKKLGNGITIFNPGSISLPKGGNPPTFGWFDGEAPTIRLLENGEIFS